jgi:N-acetylmuramoyl-L-alanine amidase
MSRYTARIFSAIALAAGLAFAGTSASAADRAAYLFQGTHVSFERVVMQQGARAVAVDDPGLQSLLRQLAATVSWQPNQRYILFTTAQPLIVSFALGDRRYDVGPVTQEAPFAPFLLDGRAYVPFDELLHALGIAIKDGILQPEITALDVQSSDGSTTVIARGALPLDAKILSQSGGKAVVAFDGVGNTLPPSRTFDSGAVRRIDVRQEGPSAHPRTIVTLYASPQSGSAVQGTDDQRDVTIAFGARYSAQATPPPSPAAAASALSAARVTSVQAREQNGGTVIDVAVDGPANFEWHRLRPPDNRFWLDVHGARLAVPPFDTPQTGIVTAVRVHQQSPDTVRIAISLPGFQSVTVVPDAAGVTISVGTQLADETGARSGFGAVGAPVSGAANAGWKFGTPEPSPGSPYVPANPRLIVIDPGHGGSDPGSEHGGLVEKTLALDMARRLRDILVARGWQVMLTHEDDRDVYKPNDGAAEELQARDDVANNNGARLFVSIHLNAFMNSGPHGATVYYYKPSDYPFAQALERRIAGEVNVKSDGIVKDKLYVVHHAAMPAALIETAYLTNPDDRALLDSPAWRQSMAKAIADGISDFAGTPPPAAQAGGQ